MTAKHHKHMRHHDEKGRHSPAQSKVAKSMREFEHGKLHSGSKHGPKVTEKKQALAIGYAEAKRGKKK